MWPRGYCPFLFILGTSVATVLGQVGQQDPFFGFRETSRQRRKSWICTSAESALLTKCCYCTLQGPVNTYSREEAKHDVIVCYCIHLGGRRQVPAPEPTGAGNWSIHWSKKAQSLRASHYVMQLYSLPLPFWWARWWIFNSFKQNGTASRGGVEKSL